MAISFSCKICGKIHKAAGYNNCKLWVQIKCNKTNKQTYNLLIEDDTVGIVSSIQNLRFTSITSTIMNLIVLRRAKNKFCDIFKKWQVQMNTFKWSA